MVVTKNANVKDVERSDETQSPQVVNVVRWNDDVSYS